MNARDIPNLLCLARMVLTVPIGWSIMEGRYPVALVLFFIAGVTDALDGFLAKRYGWQSKLGGFLDPAADKLLLVTAFVTLWAVGHVPGWLLFAVVTRDLVIVAGAGFYQWRVGDFVADPTIISKFNSLLQLLYILLSLSNLVLGQPSHGAIELLGWGVLLTTIISGCDYVVRWGGRARAANA